jgi:SAM-dependent methyltransferase
MLFYQTVMKKILGTGRVNADDSVLAICSGEHDRNSLMAAGFTNATLSNVNDFMGAKVAPFKWENLNAENVDKPDRSFDIVVVHGGLHHCYSPHRALTEMMRLARKAVVVMEARDSLMMRAGVRAGFTDDYEIEAVTGQIHYGGAGGGAMPNFVYRWTEREVHKVARSYEPRFKPKIDFHYGLLLPEQRLAGSARPVTRVALKVAKLIALPIQAIFPRQGNRFGFVIWRDGLELQPWLKQQNGEIIVDQDYVKRTGRSYVPPQLAK